MHRAHVRRREIGAAAAGLAQQRILVAACELGLVYTIYRVSIEYISCELKLLSLAKFRGRAVAGADVEEARATRQSHKELHNKRFIRPMSLLIRP